MTKMNEITMRMTTTMTIIKTYSELTKIPTFEERLEYLSLHGKVCDITFGSKRYLNQVFYRSNEWKSIRRKIIIRDNGCDLGIEGFDIYSRIIIHHLKPLTDDDILNHSIYLIDPEYLICTSLDTHNKIHYGSTNTKGIGPTIRTPNDTCPWRR